MRTSLQLLDKGSPIPLYYQLYHRLRTEIQSGLVRPGDLLGTEKAIQERYGVSRATVRKALDELAHSGQLVRVTGRGTFVTEPAHDAHSPHLLSLTEELQHRGIVPDAEVLEFEPIAPSPDAVGALGCRPADRVLHIRRLRTGDSTPILLVDHYLAPAIQLRREQLEQSLYATLEGVLGIRLQEAYHTVRADISTPEEARLLGTAEGSVVLRFQRTTLSIDERPVVYEQGAGRADLYDYSVHLYRRDRA